MTIQEVIDWCDARVGKEAFGTLGLFNYYYQLLTGRNPHADGVPLTSARNAWHANPASFTKVTSTDQLPPQGSILFWHNGAAIVDDANTHGVTIWEEVPGSTIQRAAYAWSELHIFGWWVWDGFLKPPVLDEEDVRSLDTQPTKPGSTYTWVSGDTIWRVAPRLGLQATELLEHNNIDNWRSIKPGDVLHLPIPRLVKAIHSVDIEVLPATRVMHVTQDSRRKVSFGYGKSFDALQSTGPSISSSTEQVIVAIAHVVINNEQQDFYMDTLALGDYTATGRVRYMIGFRQSDMEEITVSKQLAKEVVG